MHVNVLIGCKVSRVENDIRFEINRLQTKKESPQAPSKVEKTTDVYSEYIRNLAKNN